MSCKSAFLALQLGEETREALASAAFGISQDPARMLAVDEDVVDRDLIGFDITTAERLHMTFVFCGDNLLRLPTDRLAHLHQLLDSAIQRAADEYAGHPEWFRLEASGFELFPPGKRNLLVARFVAPARLCALRHELWELCRAQPHVTLGKFRATRAQVERLSCMGLVERLAEADGGRNSVILTNIGMECNAIGTMLVGEQPKRASLSWKWDQHWQRISS
eukprot:CAMPEP_0119402978 /NCGR_PEP_ID=MMETSP1334-20130426/143154_1 /TAXON_ID=127549 /ORGANISM="Calcidiscus leptoporus, Strain RCC1130" /LENGTH=219 /DNA_ID=CAMNT_0007426917 /DNA_START=140 /DNA_END=799 /DNA_ORIENTATION=-